MTDSKKIDMPVLKIDKLKLCCSRDRELVSKINEIIDMVNFHSIGDARLPKVFQQVAESINRKVSKTEFYKKIKELE